MYAIIEAGGKQYKVEQDSVLKVEYLAQDDNAAVRFKVLMISDNGVVAAGKEVENAYAEAVVVRSGKGPKIDIFKYKSKKNERKRQGHRQPYTEVKITAIVK